MATFRQSEPVVSRALIASVVTLVVGALGVIGVQITAADQTTIVSAVVAIIPVIGVVAHIIAAFRARSRATPYPPPNQLPPPNQPNTYVAPAPGVVVTKPVSGGSLPLSVPR